MHATPQPTKNMHGNATTLGAEPRTQVHSPTEKKKWKAVLLLLLLLHLHLLLILPVIVSALCCVRTMIGIKVKVKRGGKRGVLHRLLSISIAYSKWVRRQPLLGWAGLQWLQGCFIGFRRPHCTTCTVPRRLSVTSQRLQDR